MNVERARVRNLYTKTWFLLQRYSDVMAEAPNDPRTKASHDWDEEMQELDELMEREGLVVPPINELLSQVEKLETFKIPDKDLDNQESVGKERRSKDIGENIEEMIEDLGVLDKKIESRTASMSKQEGKKPIILDEGDKDADYQESFASQQETAQIREDLDRLTAKFESMESILGLMTKERQELPNILNNIRADLNAQLTLLSDKMYSALEAESGKSDVQAAVSEIEKVRVDNAGQLKAAAGYLSAPPRNDSPLVISGSSLKGKGKFKPVK